MRAKPKTSKDQQKTQAMYICRHNIRQDFCDIKYSECCSNMSSNKHLPGIEVNSAAMQHGTSPCLLTA